MYTAMNLLAVLEADTPFRSDKDRELAHKLVTKIRHLTLRKNAVWRPERVFDAIVDSSSIHAGIYRANEVTPYIVHLLEVVVILLRARIFDWDTLVAAALHDTYEDTEKDETKLKIQILIKRKYGERVWNVVKLLSKVPGEDKDKVWTRMLAEVDLNTLWRVLVIKYADRIHNVRTFDGLEETKRSRKIAETLRWFPTVKQKLGVTLKRLWEKRTLKNKNKLRLHEVLDGLLQTALRPYLPA